MIKFFLENKLVSILLLLLFVGWGIATAPFNWETGFIPRDPVSVDAIPDIGENQQIVFTEWPGRSPQDIEDQITYPLSTSLLGIPGVKTVRANSMFGFSSIYLIFEEGVEFYWSRSRILEKLNALPADLLPEGVQPALGPDATALGQVYWYTLEGRDKDGNPTGGWDPHEIRSVQDYYVRYALASADGVSEVASIGGFVKEYQIDVDPTALVAYKLSLDQIGQAVRQSNLDVGARTLELNGAEYLVRGLGYVKQLQDLEEAVITTRDGTPIRIRDVAHVNIGPAARRGILDKAGAEAVGGVVVARYGENPQKVIQAVKEKIAEIASGLPKRELSDGTISQLTIVPFYDRSQLITETLDTLNEALYLEILITVLVVILMLVNIRASALVSIMLPVAVLMCFIAMRYVGIEANIVALSGIAIAIGTLVDLGIILTENIVRHLREPDTGQSHAEKVFAATKEVAPAILTAVMTTIISFIPVFTLQAAEGKLFRPLAFTKTFALIAAIILTLTILPMLAQWLFHPKNEIRLPKLSETVRKWINLISIGLLVLFFSVLLATQWMPLGASVNGFFQWFFVVVVLGGILGALRIVIHFYESILSWCLENKALFLTIPTVLVCWGMLVWLGFAHVFGFLAKGMDAVGINIRETTRWESLSEAFPGIGQEFMPALDEGAFLLMPTTMPHAGVEENKFLLQQLDMAVTAIPEVDMVVGKAGRVESALDPAPLSMYENVITYKPEYGTDEQGNRIRIWRDHIQSPNDIWEEIKKATRYPSITPAPKLQPIETRLVMLQTGMRAPMGIKVKGPDQQTIEAFGKELEKYLREVPGVLDEAVIAERIIGKPYMTLDIDRQQIGRYGLTVEALQRSIQMAIGGMKMSTTVEGRERYPIRVRYAREFRDNPEAIRQLLIPTPAGPTVPLGELVEIDYVQGSQNIRSENTFLLGYVLFDKEVERAEVDVVEAAQKHIQQKVDEGSLVIPPGVSYAFAGNYENQIRAEARLMVVVPLCLIIIFLLLYFQFKSAVTALMVFSGIAVAFAGGFIMLGFYGMEGFLDFSLFGINVRDMFQIHPVNLSVAVWVGFIALFGIATDDGVIIATYLDQVFSRNKPNNQQQIRSSVIEAGSKRVRPALMTTATTLLALLPILTSTGRGSDVMIPMAIPAFGGMTIALITIFVVPVLYCWRQEYLLNRLSKKK